MSLLCTTASEELSTILICNWMTSWITHLAAGPSHTGLCLATANSLFHLALWSFSSCETHAGKAP